MEQNPNPNSRKRSLGYLAAQELSWKLKSKADLMQYLDKHSKSNSILRPFQPFSYPSFILQSSTTSRTSTW